MTFGARCTELFCIWEYGCLGRRTYMNRASRREMPPQGNLEMQNPRDIPQLFFSLLPLEQSTAQGDHIIVAIYVRFVTLSALSRSKLHAKTPNAKYKSVWGARLCPVRRPHSSRCRETHDSISVSAKDRISEILSSQTLVSFECAFGYRNSRVPTAQSRLEWEYGCPNMASRN